MIHILFQTEFSTECGSTASSFNFQYPLFKKKSSRNCIRLLPRLPVTYVLPSIFHSIRCFTRQFLCSVLPIQLAVLLFIACRIFPIFLTPCNTSSFLTRSVQLVILFLLQHHIKNFPGIFDLFAEMPKFRYQSKLCFKFGPLLHSCWNFMFSLLVQRFLLVLNAAFALEILDLIWLVFYMHFRFQ